MKKYFNVEIKIVTFQEEIVRTSFINLIDPFDEDIDQSNPAGTFE